ncbi:MAG: IS1595 family transposase, partial [Chloroflexota bacterium]
MARKVRCPRCQSSKSWRLESGKRRCSACRYDWRPGRLPVRLTARQWRQLLRYFLLGLSAARVAQETHLGREQVLRALLLVRQAMTRDIPPVFSGVVEIDETYVGGTWRNKRLVERAQGTKRGRGTTKQAVFGILCRGGQVWAEVVPNVEARTLLPLLHQHVRTGSVVCSDTFTSYTGVAAKGYVHRLVDHSQTFSDRRGSHINGLEG